MPNISLQNQIGRIVAFEVPFLCPRCGATGAAKCRDDVHPRMRTACFEVDEISAGFSVVHPNAYRHRAIFACSCGAHFQA